jgi:hypothetical protein
MSNVIELVKTKSASGDEIMKLLRNAITLATEVDIKCISICLIPDDSKVNAYVKTAIRMDYESIKELLTSMEIAAQCLQQEVCT